MITRFPKTTERGSLGKEKETADMQAGTGKDDACRCKEVSDLPPRKLLGLMISDLAFWKKAKKG